MFRHNNKFVEWQGGSEEWSDLSLLSTKDIYEFSVLKSPVRGARKEGCSPGAAV